MKEATGELNSTVVVILSVAILAAFFFGVLWPQLKNNFDQNAKCSDAVCGYTCSDLSIEDPERREKLEAKDGKIECCYKKTTTLFCAYKG